MAEGQNVRGVYHSLLVPQNWSLAVELTFYLAAPLLARCATPTLVTICAAAFVAWFNVSHPLAFPHMLPFSNFWLFVLGMIAYRTLPTAQRWTTVQQAAVALIPFAIFVLWSPMSERLQSPQMLIIFAAGLPALFALSRNWGWDRHVGELSYPIYITHLIFQWPATVFGTWWAGYVCATISILLSIALYRFVQMPVDAFRHSLTTRPAT